MFKTLKQKIAKETGQNVENLTFHNTTTRHSISSQNSQQSISLDSSKDSKDENFVALEDKDAELNVLRSELAIAQLKIKTLEQEKHNLEEKLNICQMQKDMMLDETDKIQNFQQQEINKLKNLLLFREQESLDQLNKLKSDESQIDTLKVEITRIKNLEPMFEKLKDELENIRRSSQLEKNQLITKLSAKEEEIRHLQVQLQIFEQRAHISPSDTENEKIKQLLQERKRLESYLEEAHLQLHDIKSNWTSQNLTLENQLQRLSRQVAEENAEKRKIIEMKELLVDKIKHLEFDLVKSTEELKARDNKIKLMSEEIEELNDKLSELRLENEEEIEFLRSKVAYQESELSKAKENVMKCSETNEDYEAQILSLQRENINIHEKLKDAENKLIEMSNMMIEVEEKNLIIADLKAQIDHMDEEINDKNKAIKILNQRLFDVKKSLNEEIKNNSGGAMGTMMSSQPAILIPVNVDNNSNHHNHQTIPFNLRKTSNIPTSIVLDEVKFSYLKHVVLKFLTTESKHLIRPVSTLLYLTESEEKLLEEVLDYRKSWFKAKPNY